MEKGKLKWKKKSLSCPIQSILSEVITPVTFESFQKFS